MPVELDRVDIQILNLLQEDASIPLRRLAELVHASAATCQRRIAQLRASGVLVKDVALVDRVRVGRPLTAFVTVQMVQQNTALLKKEPAGDELRQIRDQSATLNKRCTGVGNVEFLLHRAFVS